MTQAPTPRLDLGLADLAPNYDLLLCDVWGVVHNGVRHNKPAVDALQRFRAKGGTVVLVTNAPAPRAQVIRRLDSLAVPHDAYDDVATSGDVTVDMIVEAACPPLYAIGPKGEIALFEEAGRRGPKAPARVGIGVAELCVCIGLDETGETPEAYDALLATLKTRDVPLICANPDIVVEMGDEIEYCAGAIAERYEAIGGTVRHAGKPHAAIYERALRLAAKVRGEVPLGRVLAIGDAMHTDMRGAHDQGFDALFVTSGIHRGVLHGGRHDSAIDAAILRQFLSDHEARPLAAVPRLAWNAGRSD